MFAIQIGPVGGEHVSVTIHGRPDERDDWLDAEIDVSSGSFVGRYSATFVTCDFPRYRAELEELYKRLEGVANFSTVERQLELTCTGNGLGGILIEGFARDAVIDGNVLKFRIKLDQTFLPAIIQQVREIEREYPNRMHPPFPS